MGTPKQGSISPELQAKAKFFKTLAHPVRIQILQFLAQSGKCITGDISNNFPLSRTTVNQHMNVLKKAGLIVAHLEGAKIVYCLNLQKIKELDNTLNDILNIIQIPPDYCCSL